MPVIPQNAPIARHPQWARLELPGRAPGEPAQGRFGEVVAAQNVAVPPPPPAEVPEQPAGRTMMGMPHVTVVHDYDGDTLPPDLHVDQRMDLDGLVALLPVCCMASMASFMPANVRGKRARYVSTRSKITLTAAGTAKFKDRDALRLRKGKDMRAPDMGWNTYVGEIEPQMSTVHLMVTAPDFPIDGNEPRAIFKLFKALFESDDHHDAPQRAGGMCPQQTDELADELQMWPPDVWRNMLLSQHVSVWHRDDLDSAWAKALRPGFVERVLGQDYQTRYGLVSLYQAAHSVCTVLSCR